MVKFIFFYSKILLNKLETGQFNRPDFQTYTDPMVYYGDALIDPLQSNYPHLQQGRNYNFHFLSL